MKKLVGVVVLFVFVFTSCMTAPVINYGYPQSGSVNNAAIAVKDYESVGIIFVKSTEVIDSIGNHTGSKITYEMLMLEAQKLNADDVINIRIDVNQKVENIAGLDSEVTRTTYEYTASALAIRYRAAITGTSSASTSRYYAGLGDNMDMPASEPAPVAKKSLKPLIITLSVVGGLVLLTVVGGLIASAVDSSKASNL